jgi:hypothetical protein
VRLAPVAERLLAVAARLLPARLLTEWDPVRVAHGAAQSFVVAAELGRELSGIQADLRHREAGTQYMPLASALCLGMRPDVGQWNCAWRRGPACVTL